MVVARFVDGRMVKGSTHDFAPNNARFHIYPGGDETSPAMPIAMDALKAVFYVKTTRVESSIATPTISRRPAGTGARSR